MSKVIVKTTGAFSLYNPMGEQIHARRPTLVALDTFVQMQINVKKVEILLTGLSDEATDAEFAKFWTEADGDLELALESFRSAFPAVKADAPKGRGAKK